MSSNISNNVSACAYRHCPCVVALLVFFISSVHVNVGLPIDLVDGAYLSNKRQVI